jgi:hypothetical protein
MSNRGLIVAARILIPSVFVGLGLERLLVSAGVLTGAPLSAGALVFSALDLIAGLPIMLERCAGSPACSPCSFWSMHFLPIHSGHLQPLSGTVSCCIL